MSTDNLQQLLALGLFTVEGDDARLDKIRAAAAELATAMNADRSLLFDAIVAATNPGAAADAPSMKAAAEALSKHWQSYSNLSPSPPIGLFRAILSHGVLTIATDDPEAAIGLTLLLRNILPRRDLKNESAFWAEHQQRLDAAYEQAATKVWADNFNGPAGALPKRPAEKPGKVDRAKLEAALLGAAGPQGADSKPGTNPNPNWPSGNEAWATEFAKRSTAAIGEAVEEAVGLALTGRSAVDKAIFEALEQRLPDAEGVQRRARLLWWKEAGYSPAVGCGYGELATSLIAPLAAYDVYQIVPNVAPRSVEYFLRNTVAALVPTGEQTFRDWLAAIASAPDRGKLVKHFSSPGILLSAAIAEALNGNAQATPLFAEGERMAAGEIAVLVFREMLALDAIGVDA